MIEFLSSWSKGIGLSIVIVSILEMLLPNNKTKKYIRMVMGLYVIFTIISPFVHQKEVFDLNNIDLEKSYANTQTVSTQINQTSMDRRIQELYIEEMEKDITKKVEEKGYNVLKCKVDATISDEKEETRINKIKLNIENSDNEDEKEVEEQNNQENSNIENKVVTQIQQIKPIDTSINDEFTKKSKTEEENKIRDSDIQNIKKFLIEEYGVNEKCLEIN